MIEKKTILLPLLIILLSGCATLFSERSDTLSIKTEPSGATVYLGQEKLGETPFSYTFKRDTFNQVTLSIRKEGYQTKELRLGRTLDKISLFNLGFIITTAGATSWATDAFSGAMIEYKPRSYLVDLIPLEQSLLYKKQRQRKKRLFFSVLNYDSILKDISAGEGLYLSAYHRSFELSHSQDLFLEKVEEQKTQLLLQEDGFDLFEILETMTPQEPA